MRDSANRKRLLGGLRITGNRAAASLMLISSSDDNLTPSFTQQIEGLSVLSALHVPSTVSGTRNTAENKYKVPV